MDHRFPDRLAALLTQDRRKDIVTVLARVIRQLGADHRRTRCHQVGQADELIRLTPGLDVSGPAGEERDAMAAIPDVPLVPAEMVRAEMLELEFPLLHLFLRTVVAGHDHQRVLVNSGAP